MPFTLLLDILVAGLLVVTIIYAIALNRRLALLRRDRTEMETLIRALNDATHRAEDGIIRLKGSSEDIASAMRDGVTRAQGLRDDLSFLIEKGTALADRLSAEAQAAQDDGAPRPAAKPAKPVEPDDHDEAKTDAERELLKALQSVR